jgi:hypothetical protein
VDLWQQLQAAHMSAWHLMYLCRDAQLLTLKLCAHM